MNRRNFIKSTLSGIPLMSTNSFFQKNQADFFPSNHSCVDGRMRIREMGITIGELEPGPLNAITDIEGVGVGHTTLFKGQGKGATRTGVTVILPNRGRITEEHLYSAYFSLNGWGEMTGVAPIEETGMLTTPIFLTGTYNVGIVHAAAVEYLKRQGASSQNSKKILYPVVAECFDDFLSDTPKRAITAEDVFKAIRNVGYGVVEEGAVGGGTGMTSFDFKGGIGTSSRIVALGDEKFVVGVLVMANTADRKQLRIDGVPVGKEIKGFESERGTTKSIILIAATTAPLLPYQLKKIAKRVALGLAQTGAISQTGSGDIILAFSTGNRFPPVSAGFFHKIKSVSDFWITPLYQGTVEATQEAVINALTAAQTVVGKDGNAAYALPLDQVKIIMKKYHRLKDVYFE